MAKKYYFDFGDGISIKGLKLSLDGVYYDSVKFDFDDEFQELFIVVVDKDGER